MIVRKAGIQDLDAVSLIYDKIHTAEEKGEATIGWDRCIYPVRETAAAAVQRDDLFVMEDGDSVVGTAIFNKIQVPEYALGSWEHEADPEEVMVMHTLVIDPDRKGKGYGKAFVKYYEEYALSQECPFLHMDTNAKNAAARSLYKGLGYQEIGIVPCVFNGIEGVQLVLLEKYLG